MPIVLEYAVTAIVCLITAVVIQRIYKKEKQNSVDATSIRGIWWFGLAIFVWGIGALVNLIAVLGFDWLSTDRILIFIGVAVSLLNSMFILLSLPSIRYDVKPSIVVRLVQRFSEREFIGIYTAIMGMIAFVFIAASQMGGGIGSSFIWLIDIPISIVVAFALLNALNKAFKTRSMRFMYLPSFTLFMLIVVAVTHRIFPAEGVNGFMDVDSWPQLGTVTAISFKFLFILLFSILLYSWKFLSEKEEKQSHLEVVLKQKIALEVSNEKLKIANDSHLDTIARLKDEVQALEEASRIELSERQKEVLANLASWGNQKSYTEIADAMHISTDGFQAHIHQIKKLLNISGTTGKNLLIRYAEDNDLLKYATLK